MLGHPVGTVVQVMDFMWPTEQLSPGPSSLEFMPSTHASVPKISRGEGIVAWPTLLGEHFLTFSSPSMPLFVSTQLPIANKQQQPKSLFM